MRPNDRNAGWIKALIICLLLLANLLVAALKQPATAPPRTPDLLRSAQTELQIRNEIRNFALRASSLFSRSDLRFRP